MTTQDDEERMLRSTAMRNVASILQARQRAEAELARAVSLLRATLEATTDAILVVDNEGTLTDYNARFLALWGLTAQQLQRLHYADLLEVIGAQVENSPGLRAWKSGQQVDGSYTLQLIDGRVLE